MLKPCRYVYSVCKGIKIFVVFIMVEPGRIDHRDFIFNSLFFQFSVHVVEVPRAELLERVTIRQESHKHRGTRMCGLAAAFDLFPFTQQRAELPVRHNHGRTGHHALFVRLRLALYVAEPRNVTHRAAQHGIVVVPSLRTKGARKDAFRDQHVETAV